MFHFGKRKSVPTYSKKWAKPSFNQTSSHQTGVTRSPNHWNTERNIHWCGFVPDIIIISENIYKLLQTNSGGLFEEANAWIKIKLVHKFLDLLDTEEWFPHWHHSIFNIKQMVSSLYVLPSNMKQKTVLLGDTDAEICSQPYNPSVGVRVANVQNETTGSENTLHCEKTHCWR